MSRELLVSVIVPIRDQAQRLDPLIEHLAAQTLPRDQFEVIIADDGSSDAPARRIDVDGRWLRLTSGPRENSYVARNRGAALAHGRVLAFTDADCSPAPEWLCRGLDSIGDDHIVGGHIELVMPDRPSVWASLDAMLFDQRRFVEMGKAATANLFVPRRLFERHGGFDPTLPSGGDWEFVGRCRRDGARIRYAPSAVVSHPPRSGAIEFLVRRWRIEQAFAIRCARARVSLVSFNRSREAVVPRRWGFAVGYDRHRLSELGLADGWHGRLMTMPARYVVVPAVDVGAQAVGWLRGRLAPIRAQRLPPSRIVSNQPSQPRHVRGEQFL